MWTVDKMAIGGKTYEYWMKHFEEGSQFGIDGGRISKLQINEDGKMVCSYDRGWEKKPTGAAKKAYDALIAKYN